jgi:hypothetical protein
MFSDLSGDTNYTINVNISLYIWSKIKIFDLSGSENVTFFLRRREYVLTVPRYELMAAHVTLESGVEGDVNGSSRHASLS